jgi:catechol 2,3-dioxygenase-like lactoylglutathione lyase family enzyme
MTGTRTDPQPRARVSFGHAAVNTPDLDRFRRFYEDVLGLRLVTVNSPEDAPFRRIGAFTDRRGLSMGLLVFEVPGYTSGLPQDQMGRRGRIDHLTFEAANDADFTEILHRLVEAGASSGEVTPLGPVSSALFVDPDGGHGNLQVTNPAWRPEAGTEIYTPDLIEALVAPRP